MAVHHHKTLFQAMNLLESTNHYHIQSSIARHLSLPLHVQGVHKIYSQFKTHILQRQLMRYFRLVLLASVVFVYFCVSGTRLSKGLLLNYFFNFQRWSQISFVLQDQTFGKSIVCGWSVYTLYNIHINNTAHRKLTRIPSVFVLAVWCI